MSDSEFNPRPTQLFVHPSWLAQQVVALGGSDMQGPFNPRRINIGGPSARVNNQRYGSPLCAAPKPQKERGIMEQKLSIGMEVVFIDEDREEHGALVTAIHGDPCGAKYTLAHEGVERHQWPCLNLVSVDKNEGAQDQYGRQLRRTSSVVHWQESSAIGMCWRFPSETTDASMKPIS